VTSVSGRGVGLDVVKTNIEKIGGTVDVQSKAGSGTTVRIKIPLTLAIIPALMVTCAGDRYAIPQASLVELLRSENWPTTLSRSLPVIMPSNKARKRRRSWLWYT
jgi:two-component system chemotaxis sensor kinase CheA